MTVANRPEGPAGTRGTRRETDVTVCTEGCDLWNSLTRLVIMVAYVSPSVILHNLLSTYVIDQLALTFLQKAADIRQHVSCQTPAKKT